MRSLILSLFALLAVAACDPIGPGTSGTLTLPTSDTAGYTSLELRWFADVDRGFDLAGPPELESKHEFMTQESFPLDTITFPYDFSVGTGIGISKYKSWRLVVWLADETTKAWPIGSEPFATGTVTIADCSGSDGYCGDDTSIDLTLQSPGT